MSLASSDGSGVHRVSSPLLKLLSAVGVILIIVMMMKRKSSAQHSRSDNNLNRFERSQETARIGTENSGTKRTTCTVYTAPPPLGASLEKKGRVYTA